MNVIALNGSTTTVTGKVVDEQGNALPGAHVYDPTNDIIGTTTDFNGNFTLKVGYMQPVKVSFMGFYPATFKADRMPKTIKLVPETNAIPEVVLNVKKPEKQNIFKKTGFKIAAAAALLFGALMIGSGKDDNTTGLNGYAKVEI